MVISSAPSTGTKSQVRHSACPRCEAFLVSSYYEPQCLQCGYVDYSYTPPTRIGKKNLISSSTRYVFRYIGEAPLLSETLAPRPVAPSSQPDRVRSDVSVLRDSRRGNGTGISERQAQGDPRREVPLFRWTPGVPDPSQGRQHGVEVAA